MAGIRGLAQGTTLPLANERPNFGANLGKRTARNSALMRGLARTPIDTLDLIGQYRASPTIIHRDLERIVLHLRRYRTAKHQSGFRVVAGGAQDQGRPVAGLFMARLR